MPPRLANPFSYLPRRLQIVVSLTGAILLCIVFLGTSRTDDFDPYLNKVPYGPRLQGGVHQAIDNAQHVVDRLPNPFGTPAHKPPPEQENSESGEARWYSDWKWRSPFSSDTTLDEDRAVLPPLKERPPVYTYYDSSDRRKDEKSKRAELELLLIWRRAWWAQGFRPVILSKSEAINNPLYQTVQGTKLHAGLEHELFRWLAWGNMGTGILANFLALPMASYNDPLLSFLRRGEYPTLASYEGLGSGLYVGTKEEVAAALTEAIGSPAFKSAKLLDQALGAGTVKVESNPGSIAFYGIATLKEKYEPIKALLDAEHIGEAMELLPDLINSHLHLTWQNLFPKGIAVLKPIPESTTALIEPAIEIARNLSQCPLSSIPTSCPPNNPKCRPCVANKVLISTPKVFRNDSSLFTIGTVPHPYTIQSLVRQIDSKAMNVRFIRRETKRDIWIQAATKELLGTGLSAFARLSPFKSAVASDFGSACSLWLTAEHPPDMKKEQDAAELDWVFGFRIPRETIPSGKSETPVPGPERRPPPPKAEFGDGPVPTKGDLQQERTLYEKAKAGLTDGAKPGVQLAEGIKAAIEAWNVADTEAWKFVRAYDARRRMERRQWQKEESAFTGKGVIGRWTDKVE
ncbi:hypothetical protein TI39_contig4244g00022 [Zymoseptoria brevis]|uniref:Uncharacterized protein n=1 Tax=Zymoseptoria brevis TaxID=1047168 RepID=A0A0F4G913_9PEZI|nr:hypothetical protein TI39_contig4244g00022 [Zymoseptoria brevis]